MKQFRYGLLLALCVLLFGLFGRALVVRAGENRQFVGVVKGNHAVSGGSCDLEEGAMIALREAYLGVRTTHDEDGASPLRLLHEVQTQSQPSALGTLADNSLLANYYAGLVFTCADASVSQREKWADLAIMLDQGGDSLEVLRRLGLSYFQERDWEKALGIFEEMMGLPGVDADTFYRAGVAYSGLGRYADAVKVFEQALARPGVDSIQVTTLLGHSYARSGEMEKALRTLDDAIARIGESEEADASFAQAFYFKGLVLEQSGNDQDAVRYFEQALTYSPAHGGSLLGLVRNAMNRGDYAVADIYIQMMTPPTSDSRQVLCYRVTIAENGIGDYSLDGLKSSIVDRGISCN